MKYAAVTACLWLVTVLLILDPSPASAEERFYFGLEAGFSKSGDLDISQSFVSRPTRCDPFLYPPGTAPPADAECMNDKISSLGDAFTPGAGFAGGAVLGYALGNGLRFEAEYLNRRQGSERRPVPLGFDSEDPLSWLSTEWDPQDPPWSQIRDLNVHHFFLNAYYDLRNGSPFTPYIGAGLGIGSMDVRYSSVWLRKDYLGPESWQMAAAGTVSSVHTKLEGTSFGFQVAGGIDYALGDNLSVGGKIRWIRTGGFDRDDVPWEKIRDHKPVYADGVTLFAPDFKVDDSYNWIFTVGLKYYL